MTAAFLKDYKGVKLHSDACHIDLIRSGSHYFEQLQLLINNAVQELHLQVYIFENDNTGRLILHALKQAAARGVKIFLMVDAYGANLSKLTIAEIRSAGIEFKLFSPVFYKKQFQPGRRLHHKIVVVDGSKALVGGINIADKYSGYGTEPAWLDYAVLLEGNVCYELRKIADSLWRKKRLVEKAVIPRPSFNLTKVAIPVIIKVNDWLRTKQQISKSYRRAIQHSHNSIIIMASYFLPGLRIRSLLKAAVERGVNVMLIVPQKSDVALVKRATNHLYGWLLKNRIQVCEYNKGMVHAKIMVVDNNWATVGSYNLNHLSDYASIELNVVIHNTTFATKVKSEMELICADSCDFITEAIYRRKVSLLHRIIDRIAYFALRLSIKLLTVFKGTLEQ